MSIHEEAKIRYLSRTVELLAGALRAGRSTTKKIHGQHNAIEYQKGSYERPAVLEKDGIETLARFRNQPKIQRLTPPH